MILLKSICTNLNVLKIKVLRSETAFGDFDGQGGIIIKRFFHLQASFCEHAGYEQMIMNDAREMDIDFTPIKNREYYSSIDMDW